LLSIAAGTATALCLATLLHPAAAFAQDSQGGKWRRAQWHTLGEQINAAQVAGNLPLAEDLARERIALAEGMSDARLGHAYGNLGTILRKRGKLADAESVLRSALALVGNDSRQAVHILFNLGSLYTSLSRYAEAEAALREALARQLAFDPEGENTIHAYNVLASVQRALGRYDDAEALLKEGEAVGAGSADKEGHRDERSLERRRAQAAY
jgi:tetratricopeptide (TPR) repeat protein